VAVFKERNESEKIMRIAIPVQNNTKDTKVSTSFGRSPYFLIFDIKENVTQYIVNTAKDAQGGAGIKASQIIIDNKADVVITPQCGNNAYEVLKEAGIEVLESKGDIVEKNIIYYQNQKLNSLTDVHAGFHGAK